MINTPTSQTAIRWIRRPEAIIAAANVETATAAPNTPPNNEPLRRRTGQAPKREVPRDHPSHQADESGGPQPADSQPAQRRAAIDRCEQDMLNIRRLEHQRTAPRA